MKNVLYIHKPRHMTSFALCAKMRPVFHTRSIGHTGTLDPNAEGVMILLLDKATKVSQFLIAEEKEYIADVRLGILTDTLDIDGNIIEEKDIVPFDEERLKTVLKSFLGPQKQIPPLTSAIKINGKKLYEYQRQHKEVEIPERDVHIYELELLSMDKESFKIRAKVSGGTYIRSLARDIAAHLNNVATLSALKRTAIGDITLDQCDAYEDVLSGQYHLHDVYDILSRQYPTIDYPLPNDVRNGKRIILKNSDKDRVFLCEGREPLAIYEREDGDTYRCVRGLF